jgi:hypothetical protein
VKGQWATFRFDRLATDSNPDPLTLARLLYPELRPRPPSVGVIHKHRTPAAEGVVQNVQSCSVSGASSCPKYSRVS